MALDGQKSSAPKIIRVGLGSTIAEKPSPSSLLPFNALNDHQFSKIDRDAFSTTTLKIGGHHNSSKKSNSAPFRPPEYNYIQKLASLAPRFFIGRETSNNDKYPRKMTINRACEIFESFENKLHEWNQLESKIRLRVLRKVFEKYAQTDQTSVQCPHCTRNYTTAQGLYYHLEKCSIGVRNQAKKRCQKCGKYISVREFDIHMVIEHDTTTDSCTAAITAEYSDTEDESAPILSVPNTCETSALRSDTISENLPTCDVSNGANDKHRDGEMGQFSSLESNIHFSKFSRILFQKSLKFLSDLQQYNTMQRSHEKNDQHTCSLCSFTYNDLNSMKDHLYRYHKLSDQVIAKLLSSSSKYVSQILNGDEKCEGCSAKQRQIDQFKIFLGKIVNDADNLQNSLSNVNN